MRANAKTTAAAGSILLGLEAMAHEVRSQGLGEVQVEEIVFTVTAGSGKTQRVVAEQNGDSRDVTVRSITEARD